MGNIPTGPGLSDYYRILKKRLVLIIVLSLSFALISGLVSYFVLKPVYLASTTLIIGVKPSELQAQPGQPLDYNVLLANQRLAKNYEAIVRSRTLEKEVIDELELPLKLKDLDKAMSVSNFNDTDVLQIKVEYPDPIVAADIANTLVEKFSATIMQIKKVDTVSVVDRATAPEEPVKPNKLKNILAALVLGIFVSVGLAFLWEYLNNTIENSEDVRRVLFIPVLGNIPISKIKRNSKNKNQACIFPLHTPKSAAAEAIRTLRTNMEFVGCDHSVKKILFTSTRGHEGKSSMVANLAISSAQNGKRVLIIDADLRRPTQHLIFGLTNYGGLTNTLISPEPSLCQIKKTSVQGVDILSSGPIPPNPVELLGSKRMQRVLHEVSTAYDLIFVDAPPTTGMADSLVLSQYLDGTVLVIEAGQVKAEHVAAAKEQLEGVGAKILGVILNKIKLPDPVKYYGYYGQPEVKTDLQPKAAGLRSSSNREVG